MNQSWVRSFLAACLVAAVSGCAIQSKTPAPVEDRGRSGSTSSPAVAQPTAPSTTAAQSTTVGSVSGVIVSTLPPATTTVALARNAQFAGQPGYHTVKPGENLLRIGLEYGQRARDIAAWNDIANPNVIEVGQVLRVWPPTAPPVATSTRPVTTSAVVSTPLGTTSSVARSTSTGTVSALVTAPAQGASAPPSDSDLSFIWPARGNLIATFDGERSLGIDIAGKLGDPVVAAADGQVIYAGAGLRGYGNFIIVKHNNTFLTAYANNQSLLVKEDQVVRKGQKIAEMGQSDSDRVKLHFEIRRLGKSVDPLKMLPPR